MWRKKPMKSILCGQESSRRAAEISIVFSPECEQWVNILELHSLNRLLEVNWMPELLLQSVLPCACFNNRETPRRMFLLLPLEWAVGTIKNWNRGVCSAAFPTCWSPAAMFTSHYPRRTLSGPRGAAPVAGTWKQCTHDGEHWEMLGPSWVLSDSPEVCSGELLRGLID